MASLQDEFGEGGGPLGVASAIGHLRRGLSEQRRSSRDLELAQQRQGDQLADALRRVGKIEDVKPDVMAATLATLVEDVQSLRRALYTFAFSVVGGSIVFAFTAFKVVG